MFILSCGVFIEEVVYGGGVRNTEKYKKLIAKDYHREFPQYCHPEERGISISGSTSLLIIAFFLIRIASLVGITKIVEVDCGDLSSVEMTILGNRILKAYASEWLKLNDEIVSLVK